MKTEKLTKQVEIHKITIDELQCLCFFDGERYLELSDADIFEIIRIALNSLQESKALKKTLCSMNSKGYELTKSQELFPEMSKNKVTLFRNSLVAEQSVFEKKFKGPEFENIDINYYFHAVSDWSDSSGKKKTANGWIATARNFMRRDQQSGTLRVKKKETGFNREYLEL